MKQFINIAILIATVSLISFTSCKKEYANIDYTSKVGTNTDASVATLQNIDISQGELGGCRITVIC